MPRYAVDVKAFINVTVDAPTPELARAAADRFVDSLSPSSAFIAGYADTQRAEGQVGIIHTDTGGWDVDGDSDVEDVVMLVRDPDDSEADAMECVAGIHSWVAEVGVLSADTACTRCGELYGDPD